MNPNSRKKRLPIRMLLMMSIDLKLVARALCRLPKELLSELVGFSIIRKARK